MYKFYSLKDAAIAESADLIVKPIIDPSSIYEVEVSPASITIYTINVYKDSITGLEAICKLCQPIGPNKLKYCIKVTIDGQVMITFFGANQGKHICLHFINASGKTITFDLA